MSEASTTRTCSATASALPSTAAMAAHPWLFDAVPAVDDVEFVRSEGATYLFVYGGDNRVDAPGVTQHAPWLGTFDGHGHGGVWREARRRGGHKEEGRKEHIA